MAQYEIIRVKEDTWERFKKWGVFGDTQDEVVKKILDIADEYERINHELDTKGKTTIVTPLPKEHEPQNRQPIGIDLENKTELAEWHREHPNTDIQTANEEHK